MSELFIQYLVIVIATCLLLYGFGHLFFTLIHFQLKRVFTNVFLKVLFGCFSFTAICALYFTRFETIFLGLIIPVLVFSYGCWKHIKNRRPQVLNIKKEFLVLLLFLFIVTGFFAYRLHSVTYNGNIINLPNPDFTFYARISHFVVESGVESATPTLVYPQTNSKDPYHYFDIWFCGGISYLLGGHNLQNLFLVTYTIGIGLVSLGFCSLAECLNKLNVTAILFAILGTFFMPLPSLFSDAINEGLNKFYLLLHAPPGYIDYGLWNMTKMYPVYLVLIAAILALLRNEMLLAMAILSTLVFTYTTICIPVLLSLSAFVIYHYFRTNDKRFLIYSSCFLASIYLFLLIFYFPYLSDPGGNGLDPLRRFGTEPLYKSVFRPAKIFFDATLQLLILLAPFLFIAIFELAKKYSLKKIPQIIYDTLKNNVYAHLILIFYTSALCTWALLSSVIDANQFFATSAIPLINILCFILVMLSHNPFSKIVAILLGLHLVGYTTTGIYEQRLYSQSYMSQLEEVTKTGGKIYGFMLSRQDYEEGYGYNIVEAPGEYITLFRPDQYLVNLSITDLPLSSEQMKSDSAKQELLKNDFYLFIQEQKKSNQYSSIPQSRIDFIDQFKMNYLIASPRVKLDSLLERRIERTIIDDYSKQVFIVLK